MNKHRLRPPNKRAHWLIHFIHLQLRLRDMTRAELARRSGMYYKTLEAWWTGDATPNIMNFEAVLGVFDMCLKPCYKDDRAVAMQQANKDQTEEIEEN